MISLKYFISSNSARRTLNFSRKRRSFPVGLVYKIRSSYVTIIMYQTLALLVMCLNFSVVEIISIN